MELLLGSHVREHGARVGRLAGFELEPQDRRIRRIIFGPDGDLGPQAMTRPLAAIGHVHDNGEIELRADIGAPPLPAVPDVILLTRATRVVRDGHDAGRLTGIEVNPGDRGLLSITARSHWWSRQSSVAIANLDFSAPGEIRVAAAQRTQAA